MDSYAQILEESLERMRETDAAFNGTFYSYTTNRYGQREIPTNFPCVSVLSTLGVRAILTARRHPEAGGQYAPKCKVLAIYEPSPRVWMHELAHAIDHYLHPDVFPDYPRCEIVACRIQLWSYDHFSLPQDSAEFASVGFVQRYAAYWGRKACASIGAYLDLDTPDRIVEKRVERIQKFILART